MALPRGVINTLHRYGVVVVTDNACQHIEPVKAYLNAIPDEYAGFRAGAAVNFAMGVGTLETMRNNNEVFYGERPVKITHEARDNILSDPLGFVSN